MKDSGALMEAAVLHGPGKFVLEQMAIPSIEPDEILVRTKAVGVCTGELDMWEGKASGLTYPRFIGHEPAGEVVDVGAKVQGFAPGDHVSVWSEGKSYAEYFASKADYAMKLRPDTPLDQALGEPIACSVNGVRKADPQLGDSVCIVGCGFMGLIMLQVFRARGVGDIIVVDTRPSMLSLATELGATHAVNPATTDTAAYVKDLTGGRGVDIGVEAAGKQETLDLVSSIVRMEGKLEVFGFHQGPPRSVPWGFWNWMAFHIVNGHVRSSRIYVEGMRLGLGMLEAGSLNMARLVTHRFALRDINHAFEVACSKQEDFVKAVITL